MRIRSNFMRWLAGLVMLIVASVALTRTSGEFLTGFDSGGATGTPQGWRPAATRPAGPLAGWAVRADATAPSAPRVLSVLPAAGPDNGMLDMLRLRGVFNLFWNPGIRFLNGEIEASVRGDRGSIDQGGGLVWRMSDPDNYYVARYNPLENNFRVYVVRDGRRSQLASAEGIRIGTGEWFRIRIAHRGTQIRGWLNGNLAWTVDDNSLAAEGGVGFWTKADAASSFDDLSVKTSTAVRP